MGYRVYGGRAYSTVTRLCVALSSVSAADPQFCHSADPANGAGLGLLGYCAAAPFPLFPYSSPRSTVDRELRRVKLQIQIIIAAAGRGRGEGREQRRRRAIKIRDKQETHHAVEREGRGEWKGWREGGRREEGNQLAGKSKDNNNNNNAAHALKLQRHRERESVRERERKVQWVVQGGGGEWRGAGPVLGWLATTSLSAKLPRLNSAFYFLIDLKCVNFRCR